MFVAQNFASNELKAIALGDEEDDEDDEDEKEEEEAQEARESEEEAHGRDRMDWFHFEMG